MKIKKIKVVNKALFFLMTGTISLTCLGCTKVGSYDTQSEKEMNIDNNSNDCDELGSKELVIPKEAKSIAKPEYEYLDNTYGFVKKDVSLKFDAKKNADKITEIKKYEKVKLIGKINDWDYVKYNGKEGYIKDKNITKLLEEFIDVDISEQKLRYYAADGNVIIKSDIVTGTDSVEKRRTNVGSFKIEGKKMGKTLEGDGYSSYVNYWMPFNLLEAEGLHDADGWRSNYGGDIYKNNGSHGCVNLPKEKAKKIFERCSVGTKVIVHR